MSPNVILCMRPKPLCMPVEVMYNSHFSSGAKRKQALLLAKKVKQSPCCTITTGMIACHIELVTASWQSDLRSFAVSEVEQLSLA